MDFPLLIEAKKRILQVLKLYGITSSGNSTQDILRNYFNLKHKVIINRPRTVFISDGLLAKTKSIKNEAILLIIEKKCLSGEDINPFLSRRIFNPERHDYLLNDWKIHHLHLNANKKTPKDYFNERSEWLLFVHITDVAVYFIDIRDHNENYVFAQRDLLRIIRNNWPDLNKQFMISDQEREIHPKLNEKEISTLRKKGYTFFTQVDKHVYFPGLGSTSSGFSMLAGLNMDNFHRELFKIHCYAINHETELIEMISKDSGILINSLNLVLVWENWMFYVYETNSGHFVNFDLSGYNPYKQSEKSNG